MQYASWICPPLCTRLEDAIIPFDDELQEVEGLINRCDESSESSTSGLECLQGVVRCHGAPPCLQCIACTEVLMTIVQSPMLPCDSASLAMPAMDAEVLRAMDVVERTLEGMRMV